MTNAAETRALVGRAVDGDRAALERLMLDHYAVLSRHIAERLPPSIQSVTGTDDIVQQTYTQVFATIARYEQREGATFLSWLMAIAENRLRDAIRAHKRKKRGGGRTRVQTVGNEEGSGAVNLLDALAGSGSTPSHSVARREGIRAIRIAVAGLPDEYQRAVQLRYFDGYTLEETAALMGRTTGAVRGLLDRAKKRIRDALERASKYLSSR